MTDYLLMLKQKSEDTLVGELPKLPKASYGSKDSAHTKQTREIEGMNVGDPNLLTPQDTETGILQATCDGTAKTVKSPVLWEQWQAEHPPSPDAPPLTEAEETAIREWLAYIGETDPGEIADVILVCWRSTDTRVWCLKQYAAIPGEQEAAKRAAQEAIEERAGILEHEAGLERTEAERIAKLAGDFYSHLFGPGQGTGCCHGSTGKFCTEGRQLRDRYYNAVKATGRLT